MSEIKKCESIVIMKPLYKAAFRKFVKKQRRPFQLAIEDEVEKILNIPEAGVFKKGDLSGFRVHKFMLKKQEYLIAYRIQKEDIVFYLIGTHENFYRELRRYMKEVD